MRAFCSETSALTDSTRSNIPESNTTSPSFFYARASVFLWSSLPGAPSSLYSQYICGLKYLWGESWSFPATGYASKGQRRAKKKKAQENYWIFSNWSFGAQCTAFFGFWFLHLAVAFAWRPSWEISPVLLLALYKLDAVRVPIHRLVYFWAFLFISFSFSFSRLFLSW